MGAFAIVVLLGRAPLQGGDGDCQGLGCPLGLEGRLVGGAVAAHTVGRFGGPRVLGRPLGAAAVPATAALSGEVAAGPVGLDDLGRGVAQGGANLVDLDFVDGALLAFPGLIGTLAQPPADNDAHAPLQALRDVLRRLPPDVAAQEEAVAVLPLAGGVVAEARRGGHPEGGDRLARGGVAQFGVADQVADDRDLGVTDGHWFLLLLVVLFAAGATPVQRGGSAH